MAKKLFIVTSVDTSESTDGKAVVVDVCGTKEEALNLVRNEMEAYADDGAELELVIDFNRMSAHTEDFKYGCEWNISEHDLELA